jgi:hypothetical protein
MLPKAALLAYSQGILSSRSLERACRDNVLFIALTGDAVPHVKAIADFVYPYVEAPPAQQSGRRAKVDARADIDMTTGWPNGLWQGPCSDGPMPPGRQ